VSRRVDETGDVVSLHLVPEDGSEVPDFLPGQYVTVVVDLPDGRRQPRQYSLSNAPGQGFLRLTLRAVRGEGGAPDGAVSTYLQAQVAEGDVLQVSQPFGDVWLEDGPDPGVEVPLVRGAEVAASVATLIGNDDLREVTDRCQREAQEPSVQPGPAVHTDDSRTSPVTDPLVPPHGDVQPHPTDADPHATTTQAARAGRSACSVRVSSLRQPVPLSRRPMSRFQQVDRAKRDPFTAGVLGTECPSRLPIAMWDAWLGVEGPAKVHGEQFGRGDGGEVAAGGLLVPRAHRVIPLGRSW